MAGNSRSKQIVLTDEAQVLKRLRVANKLSLHQVAERMGKSYSTIAHIENGRMAVPTGDYLEKLLAVYGIATKTFREYVRDYGGKKTPAEEISSLVDRLSPDKVELVLKVTKSIAEGRAILTF